MDQGHPNRLQYEEVQRVQALALRMMSGAMPSTPFIAKHTLHRTDTTEIILFLRGKVAKGSARLQAYGSLTLKTVANRKYQKSHHYQ